MIANSPPNHRTTRRRPTAPAPLLVAVGAVGVGALGSAAPANAADTYVAIAWTRNPRWLSVRRERTPVWTSPIRDRHGAFTSFPTGMRPCHNHETRSGWTSARQIRPGVGAKTRSANAGGVAYRPLSTSALPRSTLGLVTLRHRVTQ